MSDTPEADAVFLIEGNWNTFAKQLKRERDEALSQIVQAECRSERFCQERDEAREIIRMAKAKFCEEGSDGNIASEMFSILSGAK